MADYKHHQTTQLELNGGDRLMPTPRVTVIGIAVTSAQPLPQQLSSLSVTLEEQRLTELDRAYKTPTFHIRV